VTSWEK